MMFKRHSAEDAMLEEAINVKASPEALGIAIGLALARKFGVMKAYRVMDAIGRGIQESTR